MGKLWLVIDADDTLWENNIHFERVFDEFVAYLNHSRLTPKQVRDVLDEIELENIKVHGYGTLNFARNMQQCFQKLAERQWTEEDMWAVTDLAERILDEPIKVYEGVEETLAYLSERHRLTLYSKGHAEEQHAKIHRSGLRKYFATRRVVNEKNTEGFRALVEQSGMDLAKTWMIGDSPKSDINPALEAGSGAVLVENPNTWSLEHEKIPEPSERFRVVQRFSQLRQFF